MKNISRLVVRPHTDAVYHACFSQDGQKVASCGADKTLQVRYYISIKTVQKHCRHTMLFYLDPV